MRSGVLSDCISIEIVYRGAKALSVWKNRVRINSPGCGPIYLDQHFKGSIDF